MPTSSFHADFTLTKESAELLIERLTNPEPSQYRITKEDIDKVDEMFKAGRESIKSARFK